MKRITLPKILDSLLYLEPEVVVDSAVATKARRAVERMVNLKGSSGRARERFVVLCIAVVPHERGPVTTTLSNKRFHRHDSART
jgi:hypothetical protein